MKQADVFLESEGRAWYERNKDKLPPEHDPVMDVIEKAEIVPKSILEIGCGDGWRLKSLAWKYECYKIYGVDPGCNIKFDYPVLKGTASNLSVFDSNYFDLVIYGFCLYLIDREDLFKVVAEGDRVLQDGGYLVIHDFVPIAPHKVKYKHKDGIFSYKMDYSKLWLANPSYSLFGVATSNPVDDAGVIILKKDINNGWPIKD